MEKLISIVKNGKFIGTQYTVGQFDKSVEEFHKGQNETWVYAPKFKVELGVDEEDDFVEPDYGSPTQEQLDEITHREAKANKEKQLEELIVSANTVPFDADNQSINYMSSVIGLASFKMLQGMYDISDAKAIEELTEFDSLIISLYEATFKTRVEWKNANNTISNVQLETVAEALEKSMQEVSNIIVGQ